MIQTLEQLQLKELGTLLKIIQERNVNENFSVSNKIIKIIKRTGSKFQFNIEEPNKFFNDKNTYIELSSTDKINYLQSNPGKYKQPVFQILFTKESPFKNFRLIYCKENYVIHKKTVEKKISWFKTINEEIEEIEYQEYSTYYFNFVEKEGMTLSEIIKQMKLDGVDSIYTKTIESIVDKINSLFKEVIEEFEIINQFKNNEINKITIDESFNTADLQKLLRFYQSKKNLSEKHTEDLIKVIDYLNCRNEEIIKLKKSLKNIDFYTEEKLVLYKEVVKSYNSKLFLSYCFAHSIFINDMVTYFQIRVFLDKYNVFNSNYQNVVIAELSEVNKNLKLVIKSIKINQETIVKEIKLLANNLGDSIFKLQTSISKDMRSIDSTIKWNNLLSVIQTYQLYKINMNTKTLRS